MENNLSNFTEHLFQAEQLEIPIHSILIEHHGTLLQEQYFSPYQQEQLHRMFSITKSFCSLAIGVLQASGQLQLDDKIIDWFPEYTPVPTPPELAAMTIRDMLRMQTCHASTTYKLDMNSNWVESFFITPPDHRPGQIFQYDTSSSHTLAALVRKISGKGVLDCLRTPFLDAIGFSPDAYIICDPFGSEMGGSGLMARSRDLLTVMRMVQHLLNGTFESNYSYLIQNPYDSRFWLRFAAYLKEACSWQVPTLHHGQTLDEQQGYGYQFWMLREGGCAMYGMGGQYAICYPKHELLFVITADTQNIKGGTQILLNEVNACMHRLCAPKKLSADTVQPIPDDLPYDKTYVFSANKSGFSSLCLHHDCLQLKQRWGTIEFEYEFPYGWDLPVRGITDKYQQPVYTTASRQQDGSLYFRIQILGESVGSIHMLLRFNADGLLTVFMRKIEESYFKEFNGFFEAQCN